MGTRCGQIDPGVLLYLVSEKGYGAKELEHLLYHEAGLRGLSGISNDVRDLLASEDPRARLALDYFVYRVARELGALAAAMQGIDAVVLTAGISENSPEMRARICARCRVARSPTGRGLQPRGRPAHLDAGLTGLGVGHSDGRGADDRRAYPEGLAGPGSPKTVKEVRRRLWPVSTRTVFLLMSLTFLEVWSCATLQVVTTEHLNGQQLVPNAAPVAHIYARCGHPRSPCGNLHLGR